MAHTSIQVANKILELGKNQNLEFNQMQLMKLVYIAHGWKLATYNKPLINNQVQAWENGPVIPELYSVIKVFGSSKIITESIIVGSSKDDFTEDEIDVIAFTLKIYGNNNAAKLLSITRQPNTAWYLVYNNNGWGKNIPISSIRDEYKKKYHKYFIS